MEAFISADGHTVHKGDIVWIKRDDGTVESKKVGEIINKFKLVYTSPDSLGYVGARYSVVYKKVENT